MSNIEKIKAEIERRKKRWMYDDLPIAMGRYYEDRDLLAFIDSLPEEPLIPSNSVGLEEAADKFEQEYFTDATIGEAFISGAKWQANQLLKGSPLPEDTVIFQKGVAEGRRLEREDGLAWQDIKSIVQIADKMLDDPKARVEYQNHNEEYYYKKVLDEYNRLHKTKEE